MGAVEYEVAGGDGENEKYMMNSLRKLALL